MTHPLENPSNLTQTKTWIIPLEFSIKVDDASKYDTEMQGLLSKVLNELRSIVSTFDKGKKLFSCRFLPPVKDVEKFNGLAKAAESTEALKSNGDELRRMIAEELAKLTGKQT